MRVIVTPLDKVAERYGNQIAAIGAGKAHTAFARAINRVTKTVQGRTARAVARQSSIPMGVVRSQMRIRQASTKGGALEGVVSATGRPLPLKVFKPKQFSWGVRVKVWGAWKRYPGMFIYAGTWKSGKYVGGGHVWQRVSSKSLPIAKQFGPSVPEELIRGESARVFHEIVQTMLPERISHELGRMLP